MKVITSISRILVGCLFIFSGIIKSNDPKGTGIKLNEYFDVFASSYMENQDTFKLKISDNLGTSEVYEYTFSQTDSFKSIGFYQSELRKEFFEGDEDSTLGSEVYFTLNNTPLYDAFYELGDSVGRPKFHYEVTVSKFKKEGSKEQTREKIILSKDVDMGVDTKIENEDELEVFAYAKQDNFWVSFWRGMKPYALSLAIIMCILEVVLGFAILIGWKPKIMAWLILLLILFFTFLTWYSAYYNKVTDCGCFGDFIKLKPWHSFIKDLILLFFIIIIFFRRKKIIALFSPLFSINAMIVVTLSSSIFAIYCNMFLPAWDFLPYKAGNNIRKMMEVPKGERSMDSMVSVLVYEKNGQVDSFVFPDYPKDPAWNFVTRVDKIIVPAWKSKIHDFEIIKRSDLDIDIKDTLLNSKGYHLLIVVTHLEKSNKDAWPYIKKMAEDAAKNNISVFAVTSSPLEEADKFTMDNGLPFRFNNADETLLKTIVRSNPGIMFWHDGVVLDKWSSRSIPSINKLNKIIKKQK